MRNCDGRVSTKSSFVQVAKVEQQDIHCFIITITIIIITIITSSIMIINIMGIIQSITVKKWQKLVI